MGDTPFRRGDVAYIVTRFAVLLPIALGAMNDLDERRKRLRACYGWERLARIKTALTISCGAIYWRAAFLICYLRAALGLAKVCGLFTEAY